MNNTFKITLFLTLTFLTLQTFSMRNHFDGTAGMAAAIFMVVALYFFYRFLNRTLVTTCEAREATATLPLR
jgi:hypothetical protein